jgi:signal transduction histidine kinase
MSSEFSDSPNMQLEPHSSIACRLDESLSSSIEIESLEALKERVLHLEAERSELQRSCVRGRQTEFLLKQLCEEAEAKVEEQTAELQETIERLQLMMTQYNQIETQAQELRDLKSRFISMTSHEFRTPLAVISSSASILSDFGDRLDEENKRHHLNCIQTYVQITTQILDDILLLNQSKTEENPVYIASLELSDFCQSLIEK